jgi:hypothetical protein
MRWVRYLCNDWQLESRVEFIGGYGVTSSEDITKQEVVMFADQ